MDEERLITEVQKYPELYDPQNAKYKDNVRKEIAWRAISAEIECSGKLTGYFRSFALHYLGYS